MSGAADGVYFVRMPTRDERSKGMTSSPGSPATDCRGGIAPLFTCTSGPLGLLRVARCVRRARRAKS